MADKVKFTKRKDIWIILGVLIIAIGIWAVLQIQNAGKSGPYAEIVYGGDVVKKIYLSQDQKFSLPDKPNVVMEVKDNAIAFVQSDCPDQVCVHSGWIRDTGFAACLPNQILIWVDSDDSDLDIVAK